MFSKKKCIVLLLVFAALFLVACDGKGSTVVSPTSAPTGSPAPTATSTPVPVTLIQITPENSTITSTYLEDKDVTVFTIALKDNILFSDGVKLDADKLLSAIEYEVWTSSYKTRREKIHDVPFFGKGAFLAFMDYKTYNEYCGYADVIIDNALDSVESEELANLIESKTTFFKQKLDEAWEESARRVVEVCKNNYAEYADKGYMGSYTTKDLDKEGAAIAFGMTMWGFGYFEKDSTVFHTTREKTFDLKNGEYPTYKDFADEAKYLYNEDVRAYDSEEMTDEVNFSVVDYAKQEFCLEIGSFDSDSPKSLVAIHKVDELTLEVAVDGKCDFEPYEVFGLTVNEDLKWVIKPEQDTDLYPAQK